VQLPGREHQAAVRDPEYELMLRVFSVLFLVCFLAASGHAAHMLSSNGDTALFILETVACAALLSVSLYCKHRRLRAE
jgi:hypothetical protein